MYTIYNGHNLDTEISGFRTLSFRDNLFPEVALETQENVYDGSTLLNKRIAERTVRIGFYIIDNNGDLNTPKHELMQILNSSEPHQLIISSESDKYFNAIFNGAEIETELRTVVTGSLLFLCPDPCKYAVTPKEVSAAVSDGILTAVVNNTGTVPVPIDYKITMNSDNGFVGIVSENGAMQYGFVEETDGESLVRDEALLVMGDIAGAACDTGGTIPWPPVSSPDGTQGTMNYQKQGTAQEQAAAKNIKWLGLDNAGSNISGWHGAIKTIPIPEDSQGVVGAVNFYSYTFHWFQCWLPQEQGAQSILFLDADDNIICGINIYKQHSGSPESQVQHLVNGKVVWAKNFQANGTQSQNPYLVGYGHNDFRKVGSKITLYYFGKYYTYDIPELENVAVTKIKIGIFARGSNRVFARNYVSNMSFWKLNVDCWEDRPNRYANGDVLEISGSEGKVYLNGMVRMGDEITGTTYFKAEPGENIIQIMQSDWADPVTAKAIIREAWL